MSNVLALPLVQITVQVSNNEDWIDSIKYVEGTDPTDPSAPQVDLRGITFQMEIRRSAEDAEVILGASTDDGSLSIGAPPNFGFLIIHIAEEEMKTKAAGNYVGDIVATGDGYARTVIQITQLTIVEGVTKWPSPA